ncbi:MAG TPA: hypothetical protein PLN05_15120 [Pyrinomonadaceae bacterium]|nr:hypothetical protein [Chloracidobacterium sp.]HBE84100.1 hypothetical protein [Blastocatellia bacterium]HRJ87635.1 hypothetical protein [Pyrinomonadaceae bacterium]HRK51754.1 hypothetical protein [Pyrinomonadaceae bacterium]
MVVESENGATIDAMPDERLLELILTKLDKATLAKTHCLQYIDPYGDTTFNMLQKPILLNEVLALEPLCDLSEREHLHKIIAFLKKHVDGIHTYVKFYGD